MCIQMKDETYRIREKGKGRFIVEKKVGEKWQGRTLVPEKVWNLIECPTEDDTNVSKNIVETDTKVPEKCVQSILTEPINDADLRTQIQRELAKATEGLL